MLYIIYPPTTWPTHYLSNYVIHQGRKTSSTLPHPNYVSHLRHDLRILTVSGVLYSSSLVFFIMSLPSLSSSRFLPQTVLNTHFSQLWTFTRRIRSETRSRTHAKRLEVSLLDKHILFHFIYFWLDQQNKCLYTCLKNNKNIIWRYYRWTSMQGNEFIFGRETQQVI